VRHFATLWHLTVLLAPLLPELIPHQQSTKLKGEKEGKHLEEERRKGGGKTGPTRCSSLSTTQPDFINNSIHRVGGRTRERGKECGKEKGGGGRGMLVGLIRSFTRYQPPVPMKGGRKKTKEKGGW